MVSRYTSICLRKVETSLRRIIVCRKCGEVQFLYADVNCNLRVKFHNNEESFFRSMQELEDILDR